MSQMNATVSVVGEAGVGKSSLVYRLYNNSVPEKIPSALPVVNFPASIIGIPHLNLFVQDTDSSNESATLGFIKTASLVVVVYSLQSQASLDRALNFWIPEATKQNKEVILVGTQSDVRTIDLTRGSEAIHKAMQSFKNVLYYIEVNIKSSTTLQNFFARTVLSVAYPLRNLVNTLTMEATPKFRASLRAIFSKLDSDMDGYISDDEFNHLQDFCFGQKLTPSEMEQLKSTINSEHPEYASEAGISFKGFLEIFMEMINRDQCRIVYIALVKFGFNFNLEVRESALKIPQKAADESFELNAKGIEHLANIFNVIGSGDPPIASSKDIKKLFTDIEFVTPWPSDFLQMVPNTKDSITTPSWLLLWKWAVHEDCVKAMTALFYLGAAHPGEFISHSKSSRVEKMMGRVERDVIVGYVFGAPGSGKTSLLNTLQGKPFIQNPPKGRNRTAISKVISYKTNETRSVLLKEFLLDEAEGIFSAPSIEADFVFVLYDGTKADSFEGALDTAKIAHASGILTLLLKTKGNQTTTVSEEESGESAAIGIPAPIVVSCKNGQPTNLFSKVLLAAITKNSGSQNASTSDELGTVITTSLLSTLITTPVVFFLAKHASSAWMKWSA